ncbi:MAG: YybH family protein [Alphaproteobacteria bacterium]
MRTIWCAVMVLLMSATAWAVDPPEDGKGPQIRTERVTNAQEAEERVKASVPGDPAEEVIARRLMAQQDAWNRGDIEAFMTGYRKSEDLRFASGGTVTKGWQATLERYKKRYASREKMGTLSFSDLDIDVLSEDAALVFGRWTLERKEDMPSGLFTLLFRKSDGKWVIVHDHTSSE